MKSALIAVAALVLVGGAAFALTRDEDKPANTPVNDSATTQPQTNADDTPSQVNEPTPAPNNNDAAEEAVTITYTNGGFDPDKFDLKSGGKVTVKNDSSRDLEFSSDDHPVHTENPELNQPRLKPGETQTFTVSKAGEHGFHNHLNSSHGGTLNIQ